MNVVQWNYSKLNSPMSGIKRYEDELFSHIKDLQPDLAIRRIQRPPGRLRGTFCLSWVLRPASQGADIVHATFQSFAPAALFRKPRRFIVTVHDLIPMLYPSTITDCSLRLQRCFTPISLKKVDHIIAISEFTKKEVIRLLGIRAEKISVVYQGIDHSAYKPLVKAECRRRFGLNPEEKHILVVASNEQHKRMDLADGIFRALKKQRSDIKLIKIGYGQQLQGEGIINPGWVAEADMPALFNVADIYLHTSEYEGFGFPVLEAMACGIPVVAGRQASLPEIMGSCGTLIDFSAPDLVQAFVQAILANLDSDRDWKAIEKSRLFTWDKTAQGTLQVYRDIFSGSQSRSA
jgi:glycosyltransferase involved in cell wall biosynthesis